MKMRLMCTVVLSCASLVGAVAVKAQGPDQDKQFVMNASQSDYNEITFSQLAVQQSTNPMVKKFAQKMIDDHTKLETEMKPFADKLGVMPATTLDAAHQQQYDSLKGMTGADFDKQYMSGQDTDHHAALDLFKSEIATTTNTAMKPTLKKGEKVVAEHTMMADKMVKQMGGAATGV